MSRYVGLDRSRGRWAVVTLDDATTVEVGVVSSCSEVSGDVVAVDIPLGFPEAGARRQAEVEGRRLLGSRRSTLFLTPPREAFELSWPDARAMGVSKQTWALGPAVLDAVAAAGPGWYECHPELVFAGLAGAPLPSKRGWEGAGLRRRLLETQGVVLDAGISLSIPADDLADAAACALTARRIAAGTARAIGGDDGAGAIWF